jgi:hypothetical protein
MENPPVKIELKFKAVSTARATSGTAKDPSKPQKVDFKQILFSPCFRNLMYLVLSREILIYDLSINQVFS